MFSGQCQAERFGSETLNSRQISRRPSVEALVFSLNSGPTNKPETLKSDIVTRIQSDVKGGSRRPCDLVYQAILV